jgi:hypothetical protein
MNAFDNSTSNSTGIRVELLEYARRPVSCTQDDVLITICQPVERGYNAATSAFEAIRQSDRRTELISLVLTGGGRLV